MPVGRRGVSTMEAEARKRTRIVACCGGMVVVFGMERITFEVLRVLREAGADVHVIVNSWESHRIRALAERIGASVSTGRYYDTFSRRARNPVRYLQMARDVFLTSAGLLRDARKFDASHVLVPEFVSLLRNAPALLFLRALGTPVYLRTATAPDRGRFYDFLWRFVIPRLATKIVAQSEFTLHRCREAGVSDSKLVLIKNTLPRRDVAAGADAAVLETARLRPTLLCAGQIAPFKGTHLAVDATLSLLEKGSDVQLIVAGRAPEWPPEFVDYHARMRERIDRSGRSDRFHFVGPVENVPGLMRESFLFLAPYQGEESFGITVLEAMSAGLPVVAFALGAIPELVEHERTGYLCKGYDAESLVAGVEFFLGSSTVRESARERSLDRFHGEDFDCSPQAFARSWRRLFGVG